MTAYCRDGITNKPGRPWRGVPRPEEQRQVFDVGLSQVLEAARVNREEGMRQDVLTIIPGVQYSHAQTEGHDAGQAALNAIQLALEAG